MISKLRPSSANSRPPIFSADCELDHIHPRITAARCGSPDGASRFQCPGWQGRLALYCAGGLVFCARFIGGGVARPAHVEKMPVGYPNRSLLRRGLDTCSTSQSIRTKAMPRPTTTPKNSNVKPGAVSNGDLHIILQRRISDWRQKAASVQNTPRPREFSRLSRSSTLINRTGPSVSRRRRRDQPQTWSGRTCYPVRECTRRRTVLAAPPTAAATAALSERGDRRNKQ
jgi:hypothetical protein